MRPLPHAVLLALLLLPAMASAADKGGQSLSDTSAFEHAYAASFYQFDACGWSLTGRLFRAALLDKFTHCPFSAEARHSFALRTRAQTAKSGKAIRDMILAHGGLPMRLEGMAMTCNEFRASAAYRRLSATLDRYVPGHSDPAHVLPMPCDAAEITP